MRTKIVELYTIINVWKNIKEFSTGFYTSVEKV